MILWLTWLFNLIPVLTSIISYIQADCWDKMNPFSSALVNWNNLPNGAGDMRVVSNCCFYTVNSLLVWLHVAVGTRHWASCQVNGRRVYYVCLVCCSANAPCPSLFHLRSQTGTANPYSYETRVNIASIVRRGDTTTDRVRDSVPQRACSPSVEDKRE